MPDNTNSSMHTLDQGGPLREAVRKAFHKGAPLAARLINEAKQELSITARVPKGEDRRRLFEYIEQHTTHRQCVGQQENSPSIAGEMADDGDDPELHSSIHATFDHNPTHPHGFGPVPHWDGIPAVMKQHGLWLPWRAAPRMRKGAVVPGKFDKVPYRNAATRASTADPSQWLPFDQARALYENNPGAFNGVGMLVQPGWICIDLDNIKGDAASHPRLQQFPSYAELSPSGTGIRIIGTGQMERDTTRPVEVYGGHAPRFVTVTGRTINGADVVDITQQAAHFLATEAAASAAATTAAKPAPMPELLEWRSEWQKVEFSADCQDRSAELQGIANDLIRAGHTPQEALSILTGSEDVWGMAMDHRGGNEAKALLYLWQNAVLPAAAYVGDNVRPSPVEMFGMPTGPAPVQEEETVFRWPEITPINDDLPAVPPFDYELLPSSLRPWVADVVRRVGCPPDFVAVGVMVALAAVVGRKVVIHPKRKDDWMVVPNLWGMLVGRPSSLKTPALNEALKPIQRLAAEAREEHKKALSKYEVDAVAAGLELKAAKKAHSDALRGQDEKAIERTRYLLTTLMDSPLEKPTEHRYIVNDATVEKLGELLNENPNGLVLVRDELSGWLASMEREDHTSDRAFYLECFNGYGEYTYDRIGRGTIHIESTTLSLIGGIQPARLRTVVNHAVNQTAGDDGLIQRLQMAVYPDVDQEWTNHDEYPNADARNAAYEVFQKLAHVPMAQKAEDGRLIGVRFTPDAQELFDEWRQELETKVRQKLDHVAIEAHLIKYRSLMPTLALLIDLAESGARRSVTADSARKAIAWCEYLEAHALRIYGSAVHPETQNAITILQHRSKLPDGFRVRDVRQKGWTGLGTTDAVKAALDELEECGYLVGATTRPGDRGGRPGVAYYWNPALR